MDFILSLNNRKVRTITRHNKSPCLAHVSRRWIAAKPYALLSKVIEHLIFQALQIVHDNVDTGD